MTRSPSRGNFPGAQPAGVNGSHRPPITPQHMLFSLVRCKEAAVGAVRDLSVGRKLYGSFGIVVALLLCVLGVGIWGGSSISSKTHTVAGLGHALADAGAVKYQAADLHGWQTAYAFDIVRGVKNAGSNSGSNRHAFLQSAAALRAAFATVSRASLNSAEQTQLREAEAAFHRFMRIDNRAIALYRQGTPGATSAATRSEERRVGKECRSRW